jgi:transposase InsO family protein
MDFIVELPTCQGLNAILVFVDVLTKMAHFAACKTTCNAEQAAELFNQHVFRLHGLPRVMLHDRGTQFTSQFWTHYYGLCGVAQANSSAYHPQTDGQTERVNRVLEDYLRHYISPFQDNWVSMLTFAEFAYNNAVHESTGSTPFRLNYGYDPVAPGQKVGQPPIKAADLTQQRVICPAAQRQFEHMMQQSLQAAKQH